MGGDGTVPLLFFFRDHDSNQLMIVEGQQARKNRRNAFSEQTSVPVRSVAQVLMLEEPPGLARARSQTE